MATRSCPPASSRAIRTRYAVGKSGVSALSTQAQAQPAASMPSTAANKHSPKFENSAGMRPGLGSVEILEEPFLADRAIGSKGADRHRSRRLGDIGENILEENGVESCRLLESKRRHEARLGSAGKGGLGHDGDSAGRARDIAHRAAPPVTRFHTPMRVAIRPASGEALSLSRQERSSANRRGTKRHEPSIFGFIFH